MGKTSPHPASASLHADRGKSRPAASIRTPVQRSTKRSFSQRLHQAAELVQSRARQGTVLPLEPAVFRIQNLNDFFITYSSCVFCFFFKEKFLKFFILSLKNTKENKFVIRDRKQV